MPNPQDARRRVTFMNSLPMSMPMRPNALAASVGAQSAAAPSSAQNAARIFVLLVARLEQARVRNAASQPSPECADVQRCAAAKCRRSGTWLAALR